MLANLATALFEHDRITTTEAKAKRMRPLAERLVTFAKRGDLHARRRVMTTIGDKGVVHRLFTEIAPDMADRPGGYTRITKIAPRKGDNAAMAVIELVREPVAKRQVVQQAEGATQRSARDRDAVKEQEVATAPNEADEAEREIAEAEVAEEQGVEVAAPAETVQVNEEATDDTTEAANTKAEDVESQQESDGSTGSAETTS